MSGACSVCSADLLFIVLTHPYSGRQLDLSCFIFTLSGRIHSMDKRSCLILQRAREAASLVLNLRLTNTRDRDFLYFLLSHWISFNNSTPSLRSFFCCFLPVIFLSLPEQDVVHISNCLYDLFLTLAFPWEELSVLEVIEHDSNKAHLIICLEHENKKDSWLVASVLTREQWTWIETICLIDTLFDWNTTFICEQHLKG